MEQVALRLDTDSWTYLGGNDAAKKPLEVVVRAFEGTLRVATGSGPQAPDGQPVEVPAGEGFRLVGRHFFARPGAGAGPCLLSYRGV